MGIADDGNSPSQQTSPAGGNTASRRRSDSKAERVLGTEAATASSAPKLTSREARSEFCMELQNIGFDFSSDSNDEADGFFDGL